jgi:hypothetical protein
MAFLVALYDNYVYTSGMDAKSLEDYNNYKKPYKYLEYHFYHGTFRPKRHDIAFQVMGESEVERRKRELIALYNTASISDIMEHYYVPEVNPSQTTTDRKEIRVTPVVQMFWRAFVAAWFMFIGVYCNYVTLAITALVCLAIDQWFLLRIIHLVFTTKKLYHPLHGVVITKEAREKRDSYHVALFQHDNWLAGVDMDRKQYQTLMREYPRKELKFEGEETGSTYRWRLLTTPCEEEKEMRFFVQLWWSSLFIVTGIVPPSPFLLFFVLYDGITGIMGWDGAQIAGTLSYMLNQEFYTWIILVPRLVIPFLYTLERSRHIIYGALASKERKRLLYKHQ